MEEDILFKVLTKLLNWSEGEDQDQKVPKLRKYNYLIESKFNTYQQYNSGIKFYESLCIWLQNFEKDDREPLFNFLLEHLVFFGPLEMQELIEIAAKDRIPQIIESISNKTNVIETISEYTLFRKLEHREIQKRKCLYLGLTDGAYIGDFRRKSNITNEQIVSYYSFDTEKAIALSKDLAKDLGELSLEGSLEFSHGYDTVFLLNDFSASGNTIFRRISEVDIEISNREKLEKKVFDSRILDNFWFEPPKSPQSLKFNGMMEDEDKQTLLANYPLLENEIEALFIKSQSSQNNAGQLVKVVERITKYRDSEFDDNVNYEDSDKEAISKLFSNGIIRIYIYLYLITRKAYETLSERVKLLFDSAEFEIYIEASYILDHKIHDLLEEMPHIDKIITRYYSRIHDEIMDRHKRIGGAEVKYGFNNCGLFLILYHNTPNNSLPLLWYSSKSIGTYEALFERVDRH